MTPPADVRAAAVEAMAKVIYSILEGPIANQDMMRQMRQWDLAVNLAEQSIPAAILAAEARGFKLVGPKPTQDMSAAADDIEEWDCPETTWTAMHKAAPGWGDYEA